MTISLTSFKIFPTSIFIDQAKKLARKYPQIKKDFEELANQLKKDPTTGNDSLGKDCYKVRMEITGKPKGKSGGARVIIEVKVMDQKVYVLSVYDKGDQGTIFDKELEKALKKRLDQFPDL